MADPREPFLNLGVDDYTRTRLMNLEVALNRSNNWLRKLKRTSNQFLTSEQAKALRIQMKENSTLLNPLAYPQTTARK
jgi:hypothetical protein